MGVRKVIIAPIFLWCLCLVSCEKDLSERLTVTTCPVQITFDPKADLSEAVVSGEISGDLGSVYERGFIWSKGNKFDFNKVPVGPDENYSYTISGLEKNVKFYVKAYALSSFGTVYGECLCFTSSTVPSLEDLTNYDESVTGTTISVKAAVNSGGVDVSEYGVKVKASGEQESQKVYAENLSKGEFSLTLTGLAPDTEYELTFFAVNSNGEGVSEPVVCTTGKVSLPGVETPVLVSKYPRMMTVRSRIVRNGNDPGVKTGVRYGMSADKLEELIEADGEIDADGYFDITIDNLALDGKIYVAAYAKNVAGEVISESLLEEPLLSLSVPAVKTLNLVNNIDVLDNRIVLKGQIISDGGETVSGYGFKLNGNEYQAADIDAKGNFSVVLTDRDGILPATQYHVSAYAVNAIGKGEADEIAVVTGVADTRAGGELYLRDANMNLTETRLVYWELEPMTLTIDGEEQTVIFLDRNLGATAVATSFNSDQTKHPEVVGSYFQWGSDEAAPRISYLKAKDMYDVKSSITQNVNGGNLKNTDTWSGLATAVNPCPEGYRPAKAAELEAAIAAVGADGLKLSKTGYFAAGGAYDNANDSRSKCYLWTDNAVSGTAQSKRCTVTSEGCKIENAARKMIKPVRCVKVIE